MAELRPERRDEDLVRRYLDDIGRHDLLTKEDEVRLAQRIEAAREARAELDAGQPVDAARRRRLKATMRAGDAATDEFVRANLRLVVSIAKRYQASDLPLLDLIQEGNLGLIHAVEKFDWRKGFKFSTYATWWIRQAIGRGIDNTARTIRIPTHQADNLRRLRKRRADLESTLGRTPTLAELAEVLGEPEEVVSDLLRHSQDPLSLHLAVGEDGDTELGEIVTDTTAASPFEAVAADLLPGEVDRILAPLEDRERQVLRLRYGLDRGEPRTLDEVGDVLDLTRERIRQIEKQALTKLRADHVGTDTHELLAS